MRQLLVSLWRQQQSHWISRTEWPSHPYLNLQFKKVSYFLSLCLSTVTLKRILRRYTDKSAVWEGRGGYICIRGWPLPEVGWGFAQIMHHTYTTSHGKKMSDSQGFFQSLSCNFCPSLVWQKRSASLVSYVLGYKQPHRKNLLIDSKLLNPKITNLCGGFFSRGICVCKGDDNLSTHEQLFNNRMSSTIGKCGYSLLRVLVRSLLFQLNHQGSAGLASMQCKDLYPISQCVQLKLMFSYLWYFRRIHKNFLQM